ncbi:putative pectinesterase inhibitor domain-containing protein [Rosa chinensis]|uniref:Putative pectinesterase inhibitor domain-containing protein n=1 Tax=Rosa chinensis TaxID=74649 RepID=A0A2P6Q1X6_ROSCH|nr:cell wall / vacuolar inhibitor of fructosidase 2 [Rosa chinensis]PRQ28171.1 putative pectinesterase inhibitor domain-containing protein [Rosa chinensis]
MVKYYHILCLSTLSLFQCFFFFIPCAATTTTKSAGIQPTKLVDSVCRKTYSSYSFCVESLYSDPRTPTADSYVLAYISFGLAYLNASTTQQHVARLLNKTAAGHSQQQLQRCYHDYNKAISALQLAYNDLNSETFFELADLAGVASLAADDCQAALNTTFSPLTNMNSDLKGLCKICVVVSKLFTGLTLK